MRAGACDERVCVTWAGRAGAGRSAAISHASAARAYRSMDPARACARVLPAAMSNSRCPRGAGGVRGGAGAAAAAGTDELAAAASVCGSGWRRSAPQA